MASHNVLGILVFAAVVGLTFVVLLATRQALVMGRATFARDGQVRLSELFIFAESDLLWKLNVTAVLILPLMVWLLLDSPVLAVATAIVIALLPRFVLRWLQKRRLDRLHAQLPDALMMLASGLRGGANLQQAMEGLSRDLSPPISQELALVVREQRLGVAFEDAIDHLAQRVPSQDVQLLSSALRISREVGGNLADTVARLGDTIRKRLMMEQKIKALTSQGRLQGIVMTVLPALIIFALLQIEPQAMGALFNTMRGWAVLAIAILFEVFGYLWIQKIVSIEV
ncbi:Type II secretion system F domain-containing protein [Acidithiobacillus ferrivorans]|uniref:Secretion system protein n=1 Tax=Acidithiobacillus ferrivorans TaxID=160808 RepID=A0A060UQU2_9PROT|nr:type II secretion system F family protein [Acidithiobacillus ferrivorans]MBN6740183.1 type II secretion system F family protein [Acidithiobacillus sp. MC6.1]OCB02703.1 secretion system protein [Acidithiobacillus ferrivorans]CDQ10810.1 Type II secretion system F domain-containing protein [Acidithiobacillus ferrivorans]SMH65951.1 Type II secretion system F domain-containing protein [Acidithiobacillus ferrivorans]